ncbi:DUF262 domain-containing HNH endonuclease family protein [Flavobacterium sp. FBOR7N2.3]|uniref:DUF262 domain-containing HNH endonuclease family protein n=1 Tax=Flavobacterium magnesitis TaxID=3138077 RepID=A0ABV4TPM8_9FLAO
MNLSAYPRTIKDILTLNRKYIIPRYQREYSWEKTELEEFWKDLNSQIKIIDGKLIAQDYFIGSLVLVGEDSKDQEFLVVDGQQRLTTITILLSALTEISKNIEQNFSSSCYSYVEGKDDDYKPFFKLENENPKPFLQRRIQNIEKENYQPNSEEENKLLYSYEFFYKNLSDKEISKFFPNQNYIDVLKSIRDQILKFKTIFITVENENDAQTIFETLNAKGKDLETLDLVKNKIFEILDEEHPSDFAKEQWKKIKDNLKSREDSINLSAFFRHYWISKYEFLTENKIYTSFQKHIERDKDSYANFVKELVKASSDYIKIVSPQISDWKQQESKIIFDHLLALKVFKVVQPRPIVLTVLDLYSKKLLKLTDLINFLDRLQRFHFIFSAICSSRASGLESTYSKSSRLLQSTEDKSIIKATLNDLILSLSKKLPPFEIFDNNFKKIRFSDSYTKDKKIIQYIFKTIELSLQNTDELSINNVTLEHIESQKVNAQWVLEIGNILPLAKAINSSIGNDKLSIKLPELKKSELRTVKDFCKKYQTDEYWTKELSDKRTTKLSEIIYNICKF